MGVVGLVAVIVVIAALRSSPKMVTWPLLPEWAGRWADGHPDGRHLAGYAGLSFAVGGLVCSHRRLRYWGRAALMLFALALILELGQLFLPSRFANWQDVAWSWAGVVIGLAASWITIAVISWRRPEATQT
jgi:VanZ family protein